MDRARAAAEELHPQGGLPGRGRDRHRLRLRRLPRLARQAARARRPRRLPPRAGRAARAGRATAASASPPTWRSAALAPSRVGRPERRRPAGRLLGVGDRARAPVGLGDRLHRHLRRTARGSTRVRADRRRPRRHRSRRRSRSIHGDTGAGPFGMGTYGSRSLAVGGEAIARAADKVVDKAKQIVAAPCSRRPPEDIELADGKFAVQGLARQGADARRDRRARAYIPENLPEGMEPGLEETTFYDPENFVFPFGAHACDRRRRRRDRARSTIVRYVAVDDCGPAINPKLDRRPGPRRHHARDRAGALRADPLRRRRPARDRHVRRLRAADRRRRAELRDRPHGDAVAGQLARRQGRRRGGHDRRHARDRQRGDRRAAPARRHVHRHAAHGPMRVWDAIQAANGEGGAS